jgi:hypothetical protein
MKCNSRPQHSILWFCNIWAVKKKLSIFDMYIPCEASSWTLHLWDGLGRRVHHVKIHRKHYMSCVTNLCTSGTTSHNLIYALWVITTAPNLFCDLWEITTSHNLFLVLWEITTAHHLFCVLGQWFNIVMIDYNFKYILLLWK